MKWVQARDCNGSWCVEVCRDDTGEILIRDSKNLDQKPLSFTEEEWLLFVAGVKNGDFDKL